MITDESLARLAIAWEACQLAESARTAVTIEGDPDELLARAHEVLAAAERYAATVHAFTCQQATAPGEAAQTAAELAAADRVKASSWLLPAAPEEAAADLDDWLIRHQDGEDPGPAPISGPLTSQQH